MRQEEAMPTQSLQPISRALAEGAVPIAVLPSPSWPLWHGPWSCCWSEKCRLSKMGLCKGGELRRCQILNLSCTQGEEAGGIFCRRRETKGSLLQCSGYDGLHSPRGSSHEIWGLCWVETPLQRAKKLALRL